MAELGLYYYGARWYDPSIMQFSQPDTLIPDFYNPLDWNRYSYARYNPLKYVDPDGHRPCDEAFCPGDSVDWFQLKLGYSYYGEWDTQKQKGRSATIDSVVTGGLETVVGMLYEPADWAFALEDGFQWHDSIGFLPFVPGSIGKYADDIVGLLPKPVRANYPWHHLLPQRFRTEFARLGINVDDHLVVLPKEMHELIHGGGPRGGDWNNAWEAWLANNPNATPQDVFKQIGVFIYDFGLDGIIKLIE